MSASAKKENIELVAVIMGGADSKSRFQDAVTLLNSGFACCSLYTCLLYTSIMGLETEQEAQAKASLIEHNLRLVVYIAKKFENTGVGVEDLISIGKMCIRDRKKRR